MKVSIVIVTYNSGQHIEACLRSVFDQDYEDYEVIVVDNDSKDDTVQKVQQSFVDFRHLSGEASAKRDAWHLQNMAKNQGFSVGCNEGVKKTTGDAIVLLNPDTEVPKNWLSELVATLQKDEQTGIVVSKIYLGKSKYLDSAGSLYNNILNAWSRGVFEEDKGQYDKEEEVPMGTACSFIFRKSILSQTYLFDSDFFMYLEELDFCLRVRNLGYKIMYQPRSVVYHFKSQSVAQEDPKQVFFKQYNGNINRMKLVAQYLTFWERLRYTWPLFASFAYWYYYFLVHGRILLLFKMFFKQSLYFFKGLFNRTPLTKGKLWQQHMLKMSFRDLIRLKNEIEYKQSQYEKNA